MFNQGKFEAAIDSFTTELEQNPRNQDALLQRARAYTKQDNYAMAIRDCNRVLRMNSKNADAYYQRAVCRGLSGLSRGPIGSLLAKRGTRSDLRRVAKYSADPDQRAEALAVLGKK